MTGHKDVACCGDILNSNTRKHRNTCAWIDGITWGRRKLSAKRSESKITNQQLYVMYPIILQALTLYFRHVLVILIRLAAENNKRQSLQQLRLLFVFLLLR